MSDADLRGEAGAMDADRFRLVAETIEAEVARVIVGQTELVRLTLVALLGGGHALLEGVPGLGKTLLMRALAGVVDAQFSRIQFTPDLMPADVLGTMILYDTAEGGRTFRFEPGPIFAHFVLADEINRATPKTQAAMLEAMQEGTVTAGKTTYRLPQPFFVLATQNPLEMEGTFPLPEAQLDRFHFKLEVPYPTLEDLVTIAERTTGGQTAAVRQVAGAPTIVAMSRLARQVPVAREVTDYAARIVRATHPAEPSAPPSVREYVRYGASPRGLQAIVVGGKIHALLAGRHHLSRGDVRALVAPALRHRLILNYAAVTEAVLPDQIIGEIVRAVPE